ncbi:MAG TPA: dTDP-4-dehydrorhamnose reductase [Thermomicrobiales bacterium]|nr:dTDP-4-dehydrorhamnose reductase [Thermomicrobiales bacterium]
MRVLITGGSGQLGRALRAVYAGAHEVYAPGRDGLDLADAGRVHRAVAVAAPDLIVHAGAATDVDGCEARVEEAFLVNAFGARLLALEAAARDIPLVYVSTNYVFDGAKPPGQAYHEWDRTGPLSVYGRSKLGGEEEVRALAPRHFIVRTAWLYAAEGRNFVHTMLRLADAATGPLRGVADQWGQPTYAADLAVGIAALTRAGVYGTYHLTNAGACTWHEWARELFRLAGREVAIEPIPGAAFRRAATPPANGVLANWAAAALGVTLPDWRDGLRRCLAEMGRLGGRTQRRTQDSGLRTQ